MLPFLSKNNLFVLSQSSTDLISAVGGPAGKLISKNRTCDLLLDHADSSFRPRLARNEYHSLSERNLILEYVVIKLNR